MPSVLKAILRSLLSVVGGVFTPPELDVVQEDDTVLVLKGGGWHDSRMLTFHKRYRTVKAGTDVLAQFDAIDTIDVVHHRADDGDRPEHWWVRLNLRGTFSSVSVGVTIDDADASIVAARISRVTGKRVRAL